MRQYYQTRDLSLCCTLRPFAILLLNVREGLVTYNMHIATRFDAGG